MVAIGGEGEDHRRVVSSCSRRDGEVWGGGGAGFSRTPLLLAVRVGGRPEAGGVSAQISLTQCG